MAQSSTQAVCRRVTRLKAGFKISLMVHDHSHNQGKSTTNYGRAFALGATLNIGFVLIEFIYGLKADSLSLLADAAHNLSDVAGLLLAWGAMLVVRLSPNDKHTYGWRKATILAAFINAVVLIGAMGFLFREAYLRLNTPVYYAGNTMVAVATIGVLINGISAWLFMSGNKSDLNVRGVFLHMVADALVSLGVVIAGGLFMLTGWEWLDPVVSMIIAVVVLLSSLSLFKRSLHLIFDGVPDQIALSQVRAYLVACNGVTGVHDLHIWAMSDVDFALTAHLTVINEHPGNEFLHQTAHVLKDRFGINHVTIQIELEGDVLHCAQSEGCQIS